MSLVRTSLPPTPSTALPTTPRANVSSGLTNRERVSLTTPRVGSPVEYRYRETNAQGFARWIQATTPSNHPDPVPGDELLEEVKSGQLIFISFFPFFFPFSKFLFVSLFIFPFSNYHILCVFLSLLIYIYPLSIGGYSRGIYEERSGG